MFQLVLQRKSLSENDARWFFQQIIIALDYCHRVVSIVCVFQSSYAEMRTSHAVLMCLNKHQQTAGRGQQRYQTGEHSAEQS